MDLDSAVQKHAEWKMKFRAAIAAHEGIDGADIAKDDCCELGRWLHGAAHSRWGTLSAYRCCVAKHSGFHAEAGRIAQAINAGQYSEAEAMLGVGSAYARASGEVVSAILRLKKETQQ